MEDHSVNTAAPGSSSGLQGRRCLVVDDNSTSRRIIEALLLEWGISSVLAESGEAALALLDLDVRDGKPFDFALVDLHMPGMDGFQFVGRYKERLASNPTAILMLSSLDRALYSPKRDLCGVRYYITKPVATADLKQAIQQALAGGTCRVEAEALPPVAYSSPRRRLNVLVVEDNVVNRILVTTILRKAGHNVVTAHDGQAAIEVYMSTPFDVVLMDLQMPVMSGYEATAEIRRLEAGKSRVPIIALTANAMTEIQDECLRLGMDGYITKPLNREDLLKTIETLTS